MSTVMDDRVRLVNLAYRLLGSFAEAEDAVQETYTRWYALSEEARDDIRTPGAWLTTVTSRICLDVLRSARVQRESYVGEWIPEPLPDRAEWRGGRMGTAVDPIDRITQDESVDMAFMVLLDTMTPPERVAFLLHDVFRYPFAEIAEIIGRTPGACRQLATSARRRVRAAQPTPVPTSQRAGVVRRFKRAWETKDVEALIGLLDPDATATADGGGLAVAFPHAIRGGVRVARSWVEIARQKPGLTLFERTVNGQPGLVAQEEGAIVSVLAFEVADDRITRIWVVRNPEKLRRWAA